MMMHLSWFRRFPLAHTLCCLGGLSLWLAVLPSTLAAERLPTATQPSSTARLISSRAYNPPAGSQGSGGASTGGGIRGCGEDLIALAPGFSNMGYTFSTRPTFVWYLGDTPSDRLKFTLYHQDATGETEIFSQSLTANDAGYQAFTLPAEAEPLQVGETYRWRTTLYCEAASDAAQRWVEAPVAVVEPPRGLALLDTVAPNSWQKSVRLAQAGYWYDALAQVYTGETSGDLGLRRDLLLDLADLTAETNTDVAVRWSDRLRDLVINP